VAAGERSGEWRYWSESDEEPRLVRESLEPARPPFWPPPPTQPTLGRYYRTTLLDPAGSGGAFEVLSIPHPPDVLAELFLRPSLPRFGGLGSADFIGGSSSMALTPELLVGGLLVCRPDQDLRLLPGRSTGDVVGEALGSTPFPSRPSYGIDADYLEAVEEHVGRERPALRRFAARAAVEPVILVEGSPPGGQALARLMGGTGFTAWIGYLSQGGDPVISLAIPGGIILFGGAVGIARGLEAGLARRIEQWVAGLPED